MTAKKTFVEAARAIAPAPPVSERKQQEYRKFTVPLRDDQLSAITQAVARLTVEHEVVISKALLIRLAIDEVLADLASDPDGVLVRLWNLEQQELAGNDDRRVSASRGVEEYLQAAGRL